MYTRKHTPSIMSNTQDINDNVYWNKKKYFYNVTAVQVKELYASNATIVFNN